MKNEENTGGGNNATGSNSNFSCHPDLDLDKLQAVLDAADPGAKSALIPADVFRALIAAARPAAPSPQKVALDTIGQPEQSAPLGAIGQDERALFEAEERKHSSNLKRRDDGQYENPCTQSAWEGWQARAALAHPSVQGRQTQSPAPAAVAVREGIDEQAFQSAWDYVVDAQDTISANWLRRFIAHYVEASESSGLAQRFSDMLRKICFEYSAGGYNSMGLLSPEAADGKIRWIIEDVHRAAASQAAPEHETIVQEGDKLVCTACGTSSAAPAIDQAPTAEPVAHLRAVDPGEIPDWSWPFTFVDGSANEAILDLLGAFPVYRATPAEPSRAAKVASDTTAASDTIDTEARDE